MSTSNEQIEKMYAAQLAAQKEQLKQDYDTADADLVASLQKAQQATDKSLTRTAVESQKAAVNNAELHNASGLSSGARAQVRLAQENQLQQDLTAIRQQQQQIDTDTQRQRDLLAQGYASAIRQAQAENDLAKAEALYAQAQKEEEALLSKQQSAAQLMMGAGDYSRIAQLYGLSDSEIAALKAAGSSGSTGSAGSGIDSNALNLAKFIAEETGDMSLIYQLAGYTPEQTEVPTDNVGGTQSTDPVLFQNSLSGYASYLTKKAEAEAQGKTYMTPKAQIFINDNKGYEFRNSAWRETGLDTQTKASIERDLAMKAGVYGLTEEDIYIINDYYGLGLETR